MSIEAYINRLAPTIPKSRILSDIRSMEAGLIGSLLPGFEDGAQALKPSSLTNEVNKANEVYFQRITKVSTGSIGGTLEVFKNATKVLPELRDLVNRTFPETLETEAINYAQVAVLRYLELLSFVMGQAKSLLRVTYHRELPLAKSKAVTIPKQVTGKLAENFQTYCEAVSTLLKLKTDVQKKIRDAAMVIVKAGDGAVASYVQGTDRVDPIRAGFLFDTNWNPFYRPMQYYAEIQALRLREEKELLRMYEVQRLYLEQSRNGTPDAAVEAEILELTGIIDTLGEQIAEKEKRYGI